MGTKTIHDVIPGLASTDTLSSFAVTAANALTAVAANASAGGTGATAGAYDTAAHRDALIVLVNNLKVRQGEIEAALEAQGILTA